MDINFSINYSAPERMHSKFSEYIASSKEFETTLLETFLPAFEIELLQGERKEIGDMVYHFFNIPDSKKYIAEQLKRSLLKRWFLPEYEKIN